MDISVPLLRPGVLHFLGSFFNLDMETILDPSRSLDVQQIEKGALSFVEAVAPQEEKKDSTGWEILYTSLGISDDYLKLKPDESPQRYVSRLWMKMLIRQGVKVGVDVKPDRQWAFKVRSPNHLLQQAQNEAKDRVAQSPQAKPGKRKMLTKPTFAMFSQDRSLRKKLGERLERCIKDQKRVLILVPDASTARREILFLFQYGVTPDILGTSDLISNDRRLTTEPSKLHQTQVLLLSANYFPMVYKPSKYDLVILFQFQEILNTVHVSDPLPDFMLMAKSNNREYPYKYYKDLWKVADLFHIIRDLAQEAGEVWATQCRGRPYFFLERIRGNIEVVTCDPTK